MTLSERLEYAEACTRAAAMHRERARMFRTAYGADSVLAAEHDDAARKMMELAKLIRDHG